MSRVFPAILFSLIIFVNAYLQKQKSTSDGGLLFCVSENVKFLSFGFNSQMADMYWLSFLQEIDAYNEGKIAKAHLCADQVSSWHYQIINVAMELDSRFHELISIAPLIVSVTINDSKGASKLFDKAVEFFPTDWRILYQASYQAQFEEGNLKKAAELMYRAAQNGAPTWLYSLAGGLYNQIGMTNYANTIYTFLKEKLPEDSSTKRLKEKLENKVKNFYQVK